MSVSVPALTCVCARGCHLGSRGASGTTFEAWLSNTHEEWKAKQDALRHWQADKDRESYRLQAEAAQVAGLGTLVHTVQAMVDSLAGHAQTLEITGAMRCL